MNKLKKAMRLLLILPVCAPLSVLSNPGDNWQSQRLHSPTRQQIDKDMNGKVFIYDKLTDRQVDRALDEHFNRIQAMMFINTRITNSDGKPMTDPQTGRPIEEDDGCD